MPFVFQKGQRVKIKGTGQMGTVEHCGTYSPPDIRFYTIKLSDGTTVKKAEEDLLPAP